jgi:hypothetical protein
MTEDTLPFRAREAPLPLLSRATICWMVALCVTHSLLLGYSATRHSPTALEGPLLAAGVSHWELGRYELYRVNPPLVRMVAAVPVVLAGCETDWSRFIDGPGTRPEYGIGKRFIQINGMRSFWLMTLARWACIPFSLIGGVFCFLWARELYASNAAALIALAVWCWCPMVLGNGELITSDTAAAALGLGAGYFYWRWLRAPTWKGTIPTGCFLALAVLAKTTWLILFALWPVIGLGWFLRRVWREKAGAKSVLLKGAQVALMFFLATWAINAFYGFDGPLDKYGDYSFVSRAMTTPGNEMACLRSLPLPFPRQFLIGLDSQISDFEGDYHPSYLAGRWQDRGWWTYYIYGLLVKTPHGTQALFLLVAAASLFGRSCRFRLDEFVLLLPAVAVITIVSSQTAFNHHFRYILPCYGFICVFLGKSAIFIEQNKIKRGAIFSLLTLSILSSTWNYPHSLAYFNEAAGGPRNGHKHMLHSSLDWGQDLILLQEWLAGHSEVQLAGLKYSGGFDPAAVGLVFPDPPCSASSRRIGWSNRDHPVAGPLPGYYALSAMLVWGPEKDYDYFGRFFKPVASAGYSIYIYHVTLEEANRVRRELGLPELPKERDREQEHLPPSAP